MGIYNGRSVPYTLLGTTAVFTNMTVSNVPLLNTVHVDASKDYWMALSLRTAVVSAYLPKSEESADQYYVWGTSGTLTDPFPQIGSNKFYRVGNLLPYFSVALDCVV